MKKSNFTCKRILKDGFEFVWNENAELPEGLLSIKQTDKKNNFDYIEFNKSEAREFYKFLRIIFDEEEGLV